MKKQEWIDQFETNNGRLPHDEELIEALTSGEFQDEEIQQVMDTIQQSVEEGSLTEPVAADDEIVLEIDDEGEPITEETEIATEEIETIAVAEEIVAADVVEEVSESEKENIAESVLKKTGLKKKPILVAIAIALIGLIGWGIFSGQAKSVLTDKSVVFSGLDSKGTAKIASQEVQKEISEVIAKKLGIQITDGQFSLKTLENSAKYYALLSQVKVKLDKETGLKNGDVVKVTVDAGKDTGVKSETREYKVSGLKAIEKVSIDSIINDKTVSFIGYNTYGVVKFEGDENMRIISGKKNGTFTNNENVTLAPSEVYIKQLEANGKVLEGEKTREVTVTGLKELATIKNLKDVTAQNQLFIRDKIKDEEATSYSDKRTYQFESQATYVKAIPNYDGKNSVTVYTVFKVTETIEGKEQKETKIMYRVFGHRDLEVFEDLLVLGDLENKRSYESTQFENLESAEVYLKSKVYQKVEVAKN